MLRFEQMMQLRLSEIFYNIGRKSSDETTSLNNLVEEFGHNSLLIVIILLASPTALPVPQLFILTFIIGIPLAILSIYLLCGCTTIKLPNIIGNYRLQNSRLIYISRKAVPVFSFIEKYIKPRWSLFESIYIKYIISFFILICSITIALPLPFTTHIPAFAIILMSFGLLNHDGLIILLGMILSLLSFMIAISIIIASFIGINYLFNLTF